MKRRSGRGEEIKGRGVEATLVTVRFMVSHDRAEGQELVLQREVTKEERPLATRSLAFSVGVDTLPHHRRVHHMTVYHYITLYIQITILNCKGNVSVRVSETVRTL
jgi:hypothetical protein